MELAKAQTGGYGWAAVARTGPRAGGADASVATACGEEREKGGKAHVCMPCRPVAIINDRKGKAVDESKKI